MVAGLPYDSSEARAMAAALTAIMTGTTYKTSAEMAAHLGPFAKYQENEAAMLRVIRNHRAATCSEEVAFQNLTFRPARIDATLAPDYLLKAAQQVWDEALATGEKYGYRNTQTTVIAPTGAIGLLMDCDTTGVEPDFALVKFKKLAGGGYFKIINQAIPEALHQLGYTKPEIETILVYIRGTGSLHGALYLNVDFLLLQGLTQTEIAELARSLTTAFDIRFGFNHFVLGEACLQRLGFNKLDYEQPDFNLLRHWGLTTWQIEEANILICGTLTVEGAPHLKPEHYPVFDCAN